MIKTKNEYKNFVENYFDIYYLNFCKGWAYKTWDSASKMVTFLFPNQNEGAFDFGVLYVRK